MKKTNWTLKFPRYFILGILFLFCASWAIAQEFDTDVPMGWAVVPGYANSYEGLETTTGGAGGEVVTATSGGQLASYASGTEPRIILVQGSLSGSDVNVGSNKTIVGIGSNAKLSGFYLNMVNSKNVIIRNLEISGGTDAIAARYTDHLWIDHCYLHNCGDGLIDITRESDRYTVSWCKFSDHHKTMLLNGGSKHRSDENKLNGTVHHCWYDGSDTRNPRAGFGKIHVYNNLYNNNGYCIGLHSLCRVVAEKNYFISTRNCIKQMYTSDPNNGEYGSAAAFDNVRVNCSGSWDVDGNGFNVSDYYLHDFALNPANDIQSIVQAKVGPSAEFGTIGLIPIPGQGAVGIDYSTLNWKTGTASPNSYKVYFGTTINPPLVATTTGTSYNAGALSDGVVYYWRVDQVTSSGTIPGKLWTFKAEGTGPVYNLTTSVNGQGEISPSEGAYAAGSVVSLTATSDAGWAFDSWSGDASGSENPLSITMDGNKSVTATFVVVPTYTLSTSANGQGSVTPSDGEYSEGSTVTLTAEGDIGWVFDYWSGDASGTANPLTLTMDSDKSVTAHFRQVPTYTLSSSVTGNGSISPSSGAYSEGTVVSITATADAGWKFESWGGDANGSSNPLSLTMDANKSITATFIESPVPPALISLGFNDNNGSSVSNTGTIPATFSKTDPPSWSSNVPANGGTSSVDFGTSIGNYYVESSDVISELAGMESFTVTGWVNNRSSTIGSGGNRIVSWIRNGGNGVDVVYNSNGSLKVGINQWPDRSIAVSSPGKITTNSSAPASNWIFFAVTYESSSGNLGFYFGDNETAASLDKTITYNQGAVGPNIGKLAIGHFNAESSRTSRTNRMFRGLIDQVDIFGSVLTLAEIQAAQSIGPVTTYSLTTSVNGNGSISPNGGTFSEGSTATLTAVPDEGWLFDGWSGDVSGSENPISITMDADKSITATFVEVPTYTLSTSVNGNGSVSPSGGTYSEGSTVTLTATPDAGWAFVNWSGDASGSSNPLSITMDADKSITATFVEVPTYTLTTSVNGNGNVSPSGGTYNEGSTVVITATPDAGWAFDSWSGDANGSSSTVSITMDANKSVTANFLESTGPVTITLQENEDGFCSVDGSIDNNHSGHTGSGFANTDNANGNGITWSVNVQYPGTYSLVWRIANGSSTNRTANVLVNGSVEVSNIDFPSTGGWNSWAVLPNVNVSLPSGTSLIRLQATNSSGLANIDYLEVTGDGVSAVACTGLKNSGPTMDMDNNSTELSAQFYPNPVNDRLIIVFSKELTDDVEIQLLDVGGRLIQTDFAKGKMHQLDVAGIRNGMYIVNITGTNVNIVKTIAKE